MSDHEIRARCVLSDGDAAERLSRFRDVRASSSGEMKASATMSPDSSSCAPAGFIALGRRSAFCSIVELGLMRPTRTRRCATAYARAP